MDKMREFVNEALRLEASAIEGLCREFLERTGLPIEQCQLVRQESPGRITWYCSPKPEAWLAMCPEWLDFLKETEQEQQDEQCRKGLGGHQGLSG